MTYTVYSQKMDYREFCKRNFRNFSGNLKQASGFSEINSLKTYFYFLDEFYNTYYAKEMKILKEKYDLDLQNSLDFFKNNDWPNLFQFSNNTLNAVLENWLININYSFQFINFYPLKWMNDYLLKNRPLGVLFEYYILKNNNLQYDENWDKKYKIDAIDTVNRALYQITFRKTTAVNFKYKKLKEQKSKIYQELNLSDDWNFYIIYFDNNFNQVNTIKV